MLKNTIQHMKEWNALVNLVGNIESFIEIGTYKGGSFIELCKLTSGLKISIDLPNANTGKISKHFVTRMHNNIGKKFKDVHFIVGDSKNESTIENLRSILKDKLVDFMFIDGDHAYEGVKSDYNMYKEFVKPGGLIAFHDIIESDYMKSNGIYVYRFWNELKTFTNEFYEFITDDKTDCTPNAKDMINEDWGGIGVVRV